MKKICLIAAIVLLNGCVMDQQQQRSPQFGNAKIYTTPGTVGGVSYSKYEVTPL